MSLCVQCVLILAMHEYAIKNVHQLFNMMIPKVVTNSIELAISRVREKEIS